LDNWKGIGEKNSFGCMGTFKKSTF